MSRGYDVAMVYSIVSRVCKRACQYAAGSSKELFLTCGYYSADIGAAIAARPRPRIALPARANRSPLCGLCPTPCCSHAYLSNIWLSASLWSSSYASAGAHCTPESTESLHVLYTPASIELFPVEQGRMLDNEI